MSRRAAWCVWSAGYLIGLLMSVWLACWSPPETRVDSSREMLIRFHLGPLQGVASSGNPALNLAFAVIILGGMFLFLFERTWLGALLSAGFTVLWFFMGFLIYYVRITV